MCHMESTWPHQNHFNFSKKPPRLLLSSGDDVSVVNWPYYYTQLINFQMTISKTLFFIYIHIFVFQCLVAAEVSPAAGTEHKSPPASHSPSPVLYVTANTVIGTSPEVLTMRWWRCSTFLKYVIGSWPFYVLNIYSVEKCFLLISSGVIQEPCSLVGSW